MRDDLDSMIKDVVESSVPMLPPGVSREGQSLMVITDKISLDKFSELFTTIRADRYGFIEFPHDANDKYKFTKDFLLYLDSYTTGDKKQLNECTDKNNSDMTKVIRTVVTHAVAANDNHEILKPFSETHPYRMRFPHHITEAVQFVENLLSANDDHRNEFKSLVEKAEESEKYRLYDLKNEPTIGNGDAINKKAAEFALSQKPETLTQFVINYQFYKAWVKRINEGLSLSIERQGNFTNKEWNAKVASHTLSHIQKDGDGSAVVELLINSMKAAQWAGVGSYRGIDQKDIKAYTAHLKFSSESNLAYHVLKHFGDLPASISSAAWDNSGLNIAKELEEIFRQTFIYLKTAREVIEQGVMAVRPCQFQMNKKILTFTAELGSPKKMIKTIVHITGDEVVIATCIPQGR